jgi:hypothetical protein
MEVFVEDAPADLKADRLKPPFFAFFFLPSFPLNPLLPERMLCSLWE